MFNKSSKSVSALIATILLIVVAVALIAIILTWGKNYTTNSISKVDTFKDASDVYFIKPVKLVNGSLIFKNISTTIEDINIIGYKIIADDPDTNTEIQYLDTPVILGKGDQGRIIITSPTDRTFTVQLYTSDGKYIDIKNVVNSGSTAITMAPTFAKVFGGASIEYFEFPNLIIQTSDGGYLVLGYTQSYGAGSGDIWLLKINQDGTLDWNVTFGGENYDDSRSLIETSDNKYLVSGYTRSYGAGGNDIWLLKISQDGTLDWNQTYGGENYEFPTSLIETSDNKYLVSGGTQSYGAGSNDIWLLKINQDGTLDWNHTFGGESSESSTSLIETSDNEYLVSGYTQSYGAGSDDIWLLKINQDGTLDWNHTFGGESSESSTSLIETSDNEYLVSGFTYSYGAGSVDIWLLKINEDGTLDWNVTFGGESYESSTSLIETSDNKYLVSGFTYSYGAGSGDIWLLKINQDGTLDWNETFGGGASSEFPTSLIETSDNEYLMIGSAGDDSDQMFVVKTDLLGNLDWNNYYGVSYENGGGYDNITNVIETADNGFLYGGYTGTYGEYDYDLQLFIIKTDSSGLMDFSDFPINPVPYTP